METNYRHYLERWEKQVSMNNFQWMVPTNYVFGRGAEDQIGSWAADQGISKALVVYGQGHVLRSGLLDQVLASLDAAGISHVESGGVRPNPEVSKVREVIELAKAEQVDLFVAVGGGSVIDTCKAAAAGALYSGDVWDFYRRPNPVKVAKALPIAVVLTIPAAGSESSNSAVIQNDAEHAKLGLHSDFVRPKVAFMDPELTMSLPAWQTFSGITDMCAHLFERFFSDTGDVSVTDNINIALLRSIRAEALKLVRNPQDYEARASIMWAASLAHNGLAGVGRDEDWASHGLEHGLSAVKPEVTHGAGLAVIFPAWMRHVHTQNNRRFIQLGRELFGLVTTGNDDADALVTIDRVQEFFTSLGMPRYLDEFGFTRADVDALVEAVFKAKSDPFGSFMALTHDDVREIYLSAFKPLAPEE